jgi:hypothetical protein
MAELGRLMSEKNYLTEEKRIEILTRFILNFMVIVKQVELCLDRACLVENKK